MPKPHCPSGNQELRKVCSAAWFTTVVYNQVREVAKKEEVKINVYLSRHCFTLGRLAYCWCFCLHSSPVAFAMIDHR